MVSMCMCVLSVIRSNRQDIFFSHTLAGVSLVEVEETVADVMTANHAQGARRAWCVLILLRFRPDGLSTVKVDEKERFEEIKERLRVILENQIVQFRWTQASLQWGPPAVANVA